MAIATASPRARRLAARADLRKVARDAVSSDWKLAIVGLSIGFAIVAGMVAESPVATTIAAVTAIVSGLVYPPVGLVVLGFMGPLRSPLVIPAPGLNSVLVAAIILGCILRWPVERPRLRIGAPVVLASAFVLYAFMQQAPEMLAGYATDKGHDIGFLFYQLATGLATIIAAGMVLRGRSPYPVLAAVLVGALFAAVLAILTADGLPFARLANLIPVSDGDGRATGPFGNPNAFGQLLAYATTLGLGLLLLARSWRLRVALAAMMATFLYAMFISLSRGATVALLGGVIVLAFTRSRRAGIITLVVALTMAVVVYPAFVQWRLTNLEGAASQTAYAELASSDGGRLEAVLAAPALFAKSPIFGIGFGEYKFMTAAVTENQISFVAHNWYGTIFAEQGLLGLAVWLLLIVSVVLALRTRPYSQRSIGYSVLAAGCAGSFFLQPPTQFQLSVLPVMVITAVIVARWRGTEPRPTARALDR